MFHRKISDDDISLLRDMLEIFFWVYQRQPMVPGGVELCAAVIRLFLVLDLFRHSVALENFLA
jgi:hypothetical protein